MKIKLWKKIKIIWLKSLAPGWSTCGHCDIPWKFVKRHETKCAKNLWCFPLCEKCWSELTIIQRLPHYQELMGRWGDSGVKYGPAVTRSVLNGG